MRTIQSPGVEINEYDVSGVANTNLGATTFFATGFTSKGPTDEVINITSVDDFVNVFGLPTNAAERYFFYTVKPILNRTTNLLVSRLPYGANLGEAYATEYSALIYPHITLNAGAEEIAAPYYEMASSVTPSNDPTTKKVYVLGEPVLVELSKEDYDNIANGGVTWTQSYNSVKADFATSAGYGKAPIIVLNKRNTTINPQYEGYYIGLIDNTNLDPSSGYNSITKVKSISSVFASGSTPDVTLPEERLGFKLTSAADSSDLSLSKTFEKLPSFDMYGKAYDDHVILGAIKLRKDPYSTNSIKLTSTVAEYFIGSLDAHSKKVDPTGGAQLSNFIQTQTETDGVEVRVLVNPNVSDIAGTGWLDASGLPKHKVRFLTSALGELANAALDGTEADRTNFFARTGISASTAAYLATEATTLKANDAIYAIGAFASDMDASKVIGNIPGKLEKILSKVEDREYVEFDIIPEGGLSTIHAYSTLAVKDTFDDTDFTNDKILSEVEKLKTSNEVSTSDMRDAFLGVYNVFNSLVEKRKDCTFIFDPLRWFFVEGANKKVWDKRDFVFSLQGYWAIKHLFDTVNSNRTFTYAQWAKVTDTYTGANVWVPFSGVAAGLIVNSDQNSAPWYAPAGYNRGIVTGVLDLAWNPNQSQRDLLFKIKVNTVSKTPDGWTVLSAATSQKRDTAFSDIDVRRIFLLLERATRKSAKYFLFEPNTEYTRSNFRGTLKPIFEQVKAKGGVQDYLIVCDARNNTPDTIDAGELNCKVLIKPTRHIKYITVDFYNTKQSQDFNELI